MKPQIKIAFASGPDDLNRQLIDRVAEIYPELPLMVVSEFAPHRGEWVPYHVFRSLRDNLDACRAALAGRRIRLAAVLLVPRMPYRRMRLIALLLSPRGFLAYNENLGSFMLRPRNIPTIGRHLTWRLKNLLRSARVRTWLLRFRHPRNLRIPLLTLLAKLWWNRGAGSPACKPAVMPALLPGVTVIIPTRDGRSLLADCLPPLLRELTGIENEILIIDNGSTDDTAAWLSSTHPTAVVHVEPIPLSFARAVNRGIANARFHHTLLLNNDMLVQPNFFAPLLHAFPTVPDLFCATAQIFFPPGMRREETGKSVMRQTGPTDFPIRCDDPIPGEDLTYVLYGSGGCSLFDTAKLRELDGLNEIFDPAYVEDLDLGYRGWQCGWPTVFVAGAQVEHRHRATTSRYFSPTQIASFIEINYLRFLKSAVASKSLFRRLWGQAIYRLQLLSLRGEPSADAALATAWKRWGRRFRLPHSPKNRAGGTACPTSLDEEAFLALTAGDVAVFPSRNSSSKRVILIVTPYLPFPLSHGGAVRMFNLISRAAPHYDHVIVSYCDTIAAPPVELLQLCPEVVLVRRPGTHFRKSTGRPDVVEEFDSLAFRAALRQTVRKWAPSIAQLEFTQMAQFVSDCAPAKTILVEHDITFDLQEQLLQTIGQPLEQWELRRQIERWREFESAAWKSVNCVVTMSQKDRDRAGVGVCLPNGVDTDRFRPTGAEPEPRRLLFIGSFAHLPNLLAIDFFVRDVWPLLHRSQTKLHIIAGSRPKYFVDYYANRLSVDLCQSDIELEGFVADVRPAYERAAIVIAPLVASAGTNIKVLEAMAMGKAVVSTTAGINGLDLTPGVDVIVADSASQIAAAIHRLIENESERRRLEQAARATVLARYDWEKAAKLQGELYEDLMA